jgi:hypothetical protein
MNKILGYTLFQFRGNHKFILRSIVCDVKDVRFATDLTVFDIGLPPASRTIDRRLIPFATTRALKTITHQ